MMIVDPKNVDIVHTLCIFWGHEHHHVRLATCLFQDRIGLCASSAMLPVIALCPALRGSE